VESQARCLPDFFALIVAHVHFHCAETGDGGLPHFSSGREVCCDVQVLLLTLSTMCNSALPLACLRKRTKRRDQCRMGNCVLCACSAVAKLCFCTVGTECAAVHVQELSAGRKVQNVRSAGGKWQQCIASSTHKRTCCQEATKRMEEISDRSDNAAAVILVILTSATQG